MVSERPSGCHRRANCYDINAVAENFLGHRGEELFHHHRFHTVEAFATALDDYITWYNTTRIKSSRA
ncbi:IS3 family transposase [Nocardia sp. NPDC049220]|uniref:IS3 family transposase n=1 Tax=Nocardia sp. NPDC049220 TaxID=3155273 RepID=UPI0033FBADC9